MSVRVINDQRSMVRLWRMASALEALADRCVLWAGAEIARGHGACALALAFRANHCRQTARAARARLAACIEGDQL